MSLNQTLSDMFKTMAAVLDLRGEPVFKSIAFTKVARLLDDNSFDVAQAVREGKLESIQGIGKSSRKVIEDLATTGKSADYDELVSSVPAGLIEMLSIPGLGPKTVALFWRERGITSVDELSKAIDESKLDGLKGVGAKKIEQIKQGLQIRAVAGKRIGLPIARLIAQKMLERLRDMKDVVKVEPAGSFRRGRETVGDLDFICALRDGADGESVTKAFAEFPNVKQVLGQGPTKASVLTDANLQVDLRVVPIERFGSAIQYFTGSKEHNVKLRGLAQDKGLTLNEWGLFKASEWDKEDRKAKPIASKSEAEVYESIGLVYIEPELREGRDELELAAKNSLPDLVTVNDLKGELHCHTTASDGVNSIEEMADAAKALGYEYIVITDHSKSQVQAHGLDANRLLKQVEIVRSFAGKMKGIHILIGSEVDILADGHLDYDDDVLKELDFVVASPHTALRQDETKATDRFLRAIDNRYVNVIGHATGRLIDQRPGLTFDFRKVFAHAAETGTALEINAAWPRLDLNDINARLALELGCTLTIDTDAHDTAGLSMRDLGVTVARRAGATRKQVLNCQPLGKILAWVKAKR